MPRPLFHTRHIAATAGALAVFATLAGGLFYIWETRSIAEDAEEAAERAEATASENRAILWRINPDIDFWTRRDGR